MKTLDIGEDLMCRAVHHDSEPGIYTDANLNIKRMVWEARLTIV